MATEGSFAATPAGFAEHNPRRSSSKQRRNSNQTQRPYDLDTPNLQRREDSQCGGIVRQFADNVSRTGQVMAALGNKMNEFSNKVNHLSSTISLSDLNQALNPIIPPSVPKEGPPPRDPFRDAEFARISDLLELYGKSEWSRRPRTFTLLRMIGSIDAIEAFIAENLTDLSLPYTERNLPKAVKGTQSRRRFLDLQSLVKTHAADLEKEGRHTTFPQSADNNFQSLRPLGGGGFGEVDHVWSRISLRDFARKRIARGRNFKQDRMNIANFTKELETLKLLQHRHLVQLIGSYTDPDYVGLIMHPVADMNLATYLNQDMDQRERQICLRRFYGCLASAVLYLHEQQIKHKDIKPANVLIRGTDVFLTDFGTSRHWNDGERSTTAGTVPAYTPRYCPPEVANFEERRMSTDIWSLGCCYLEMAAVLNNRTLREMKTFFGTNGTQSEFFYANEEATNLWIEKLIKESESHEDIEPLKELIPWMLQRMAKERPTAQQVVNCILNEFESRQAFYGLCCGEDDVTIRPTYEDLPPSYSELSLGSQTEQLSPTVPSSTSTLTENNREIYESQQPEDNASDPRALEDPLVQPRQPVAPLVSEPSITLLRRGSESSTPGDQTEISLPRASELAPKYQEQAETFLDLKRKGALSILHCLWPGCSLNLNKQPFTTKESLQEHYRSAHGTHDFSWSCLLDDSRAGTAHPDTTTAVPAISVTQILDEQNNQGSSKIPDAKSTAASRSPESVASPKIYVCGPDSQTISQTQSPSKPFINGAQADAMSSHIGLQQPMDVSEASHSKRVHSRSRSRSIDFNSEGDAESKADASHKKGVRFEETQNSNQGIGETGKTGFSNSRFTLLPDDRRPEPTTLPASYDEENIDLEEYLAIAPEPLSLPSIGRGFGKEQLPSASRAPSYVLAGTNRFTNAEIDAFMSQSYLTITGPPVFVYGSFMFPSIIKAQADRSLKGIYSSQYQRRLAPSFQDWCRANFSLKHAAEFMTPAVLKGFDRWKPRGLRCAAIQDARLTRNVIELEHPRRPRGSEDIPMTKLLPGYVQGFLVFGLSEEALKTCDELFPLKECQSRNWQRSLMARSRSRSREKRSDGLDEEMPKEHFKRKKVNVDIELKDGRIRNVEAFTYVWAHNFGLEGPWNINDFIKRPCFASSSEPEKSDERWRAEEHELAKNMKMIYALPGDVLARAVKEGNTAAVEALLDDGDDVNGACHLYGTPLQTAVVTLNEDMVRFLVDEGADVNKKGGQYHTPLLAAVVCGHEKIVSFLLRHQAEVLVDCGRYVSALYQAVSHSNEEIVYLLLERGAWLSQGYNELLDLAAERGNEAIMDLLVEYDVRKIHYDLRAYREYRGRLERRNKHSNKGQELSMTSGAVLRAVVSQALMLKGSHGTWQGRKGVEVLKAALEAGAPESVINSIGDNLKTVSSVIDYFRNAATELLNPQPPSTKNLESSHDGDATIEEVSDSSESGDDPDDHGVLVASGSFSAGNGHPRTSHLTPRGRPSPQRTHSNDSRSFLNVPNPRQRERANSDTSRDEPKRAHFDTPSGHLAVPKPRQRERASSDTSRENPRVTHAPLRFERKVCSACNGRGRRQGTGCKCSEYVLI